LIPAYLKIEYRGVPGYERIVSLFTIHNLAYQGNFWHWDMLLTGLDWKYFNWHQMEFYGKLNLMKTGLVFADALNTVSPRYAEEIQTQAQGRGLDGLLLQRRNVLSGIINGVDYHEWNPATDPHLPLRYDLRSVTAGKAACKAALQSELGLPALSQAPLVGVIGRLTDQKGVDLISGVMQNWLQESNVQWVLLGTGDPKYHELFTQLAERWPQKVAVRLAFSEPLAHRIEAGSDMFLMPSEFEPCGLNQLYSLKYGTVPVVRATGGLANTVTDTTSETLASGTATGFSFREYSIAALAETLRRACDTYAQPHVWSQIIANGMQQDWSWNRSARDYVDLYRSTSNRVLQHQGLNSVG
jgi:starch synthase